jgi:hypothetical protein
MPVSAEVIEERAAKIVGRGGAGRAHGEVT